MLRDVRHASMFLPIAFDVGEFSVRHDARYCANNNLLSRSAIAHRFTSSVKWRTWIHSDSKDIEILIPWPLFPIESMQWVAQTAVAPCPLVAGSLGVL